MSFKVGNSKALGVRQIFDTSITASANVGSLTVATVNNEPVIVTSLVIYTATLNSDLESVVVEGGPNGNVKFVTGSASSGSNYQSTGSQVGYQGIARLESTETITLDLSGSSTSSVDLNMNVEYFAVNDNGSLV